MRKISYIQAINESLKYEMHNDENVIIMGEDVAGGGDRDEKLDAWGGPMRLTKGLVKEFGRNSKFQSELFTFKSKESCQKYLTIEASSLKIFNILNDVLVILKSMMPR